MYVMMSIILTFYRFRFRVWEDARIVQKYQGYTVCPPKSSLWNVFAPPAPHAHDVDVIFFVNIWVLLKRYHEVGSFSYIESQSMVSFIGSLVHPRSSCPHNSTFD